MPKFSIVSPVYNVSRYLDDFFGCIERQTYGVENLEIVLVDDGSTDDSYEKCVAFRERHPANVVVLTQENAGQGPARNAGLQLVTGEWVTFPDPDDVLNDGYFAAIDQYMTLPESAETALFASHLVRWIEAEDKIKDDHPTAFRFKGGTQTIDLDTRPNYIHGNIPISFFRYSVVRERQLQFSSNLRKRFEDGRFLSEYLLHSDRPVIAIVDEATYDYRIRADQSSTVQTAGVSAETYANVARHGYLHVAQLAKTLHGHVPRWLQTLIIYDLMWLMKSDVVHAGRAVRLLPMEVLDGFHEDVAAVRPYLDTDVILGYDMMSVQPWLIEALAFGYGEKYIGPMRITAVSKRQNLVEISYTFTGDVPDERFVVRGQLVEPRFQKVQQNFVLGRDLLRTRRVWVAAHGMIQVDLDKRPRPFEATPGDPAKVARVNRRHFKYRRREFLRATEWESFNALPPRFVSVRGSLRRHVRTIVKSVLVGLRGAISGEAWADRLLVAYAALPPVRRRFLGAWAFIDRDWNANDSAEELYRWLMVNNTRARVWFVLRRESLDWKRLKREGFRLVDYGGFRWKALMLLSDYVISSHADRYITNPLPAVRYGRPQWKFVFLQHGVIKGDLSRWLNGKQIDLLVTSTEPEYDYISGPSPYKYGPGQVRLTGLPRHDALLAKSGRIPAAQVNQLLIAPTWRQYLIGNLRRGSERELHETFRHSRFAQEWSALVSDPELRDVAQAHGLEIVFLPHPNFEPYEAEFSIPSWVRVQKYNGADIQDVVARSALMITDYSSIAFNMAYLLRPTAYFQFDREEYRAFHTEGDAYFDYERDGFGPVVPDVQSLVKAVRAVLEDSDVAQTYRARAEATFPVRDGRNSERVFRAISELSKSLKFKDAVVSASTDSWERWTTLQSVTSAVEPSAEEEPV